MFINKLHCSTINFTALKKLLLKLLNYNYNQILSEKCKKRNMELLTCVMVTIDFENNGDSSNNISKVF